MSVFNRLRSLLRSDVDRTYAADEKPIMDFSTIDVEKVKKDLEIEKRGRERGAKGEPPSDQVGRDEVELEIIGTVTVLRNEAYENFTKQLSAYGGRLARLDLRTIAPEIKGALQNAEADFSAEVQKDTNHVHARQHDVIAARDAYLGFRKRHGLDRLPEVDQNALLNMGLLLILFVLETAANAGFFSATHPGGWLGAAFEAAGISVVNIAFGFVLGAVGFRYVQHSAIVKKVGAWLLVLSLLGLAAIFNLFAAHYRDAFQSIPPDVPSFMAKASQIAFSSLLGAQWQLLGFQSYLMVLVGTIIVLSAAYKGYTWSDPYPGYKPVYHRFLVRQDEYLMLVDELVRNLQNRNNDAYTDLRESITDVRRRDSEYGVVISERERLVQRYNGHVEALVRTGETLLQMYRAANRGTRSSTQPQSFSVPWAPGWAPETAAADDTATERRKTVVDVLAAISASQDRLLEAFKAALTEYGKLRDFQGGEKSGGSS